MSKKEREPEPIADDELFVDPENIVALTEALRPKKDFYPLTLPSGQKMQISFHVSSMAFGMEAGRGEKRIKESDKIDPDRERRFFIKRMNRALEDGWRIVDDLSRDKKENKSALEYLKTREIPVSLINHEDWNTLQEIAFPGFFDESETIRNRAASIRSGSLQSVPRPDIPEPLPD